MADQLQDQLQCPGPHIRLAEVDEQVLKDIRQNTKAAWTSLLHSREEVEELQETLRERDRSIAEARRELVYWKNRMSSSMEIGNSQEARIFELQAQEKKLRKLADMQMNTIRKLRAKMEEMEKGSTPPPPSPPIEKFT